jgi:hypothetical protein
VRCPLCKEELEEGLERTGAGASLRTCPNQRCPAGVYRIGWDRDGITRRCPLPFDPRYLGVDLVALDSPAKEAMKPPEPKKDEGLWGKMASIVKKKKR